MLKNIENNDFNALEIEKIMNRDFDVLLSKELAGVIYSLGRDAKNDVEYDYAFNHLVKLSKSAISDIRIMAIQGFSLLAYSMEKLDRDIVEPIIINEWNNSDIAQKRELQKAIDDINHFLEWGFVVTD